MPPLGGSWERTSHIRKAVTLFRICIISRLKLCEENYSAGMEYLRRIRSRVKCTFPSPTKSSRSWRERCRLYCLDSLFERITLLSPSFKRYHKIFIDV